MKTFDQKKKFCYLGLALACLVTVEVTAQSPYSWRGPERNGNYHETGLLKTWPTEGRRSYGKPWMQGKDIQVLWFSKTACM